MTITLLRTERLLLEGKDALDLLHRISTADIQHLPLNSPCDTLILNAQGKMECRFTLTKLTEATATLDFDEVTPQANSAATPHQDHFKKLMDHYTFSEKYSLSPGGTQKLPTQSLEEIQTEEICRIHLLSPKIGNEWLPNGQTAPLEINLRAAIHDQKGCYPGQEIIEKIIALGSPPKKLCVVSSTTSANSLFSPLSLPLPLFSEGQNQEVGLLTSLIENGNNALLGLALLRKTHARSGTKIKTASAQIFTVEKSTP